MYAAPDDELIVQGAKAKETKICHLRRFMLIHDVTAQLSSKQIHERKLAVHQGSLSNASRRFRPLGRRSSSKPAVQPSHHLGTVTFPGVRNIRHKTPFE